MSWSKHSEGVLVYDPEGILEIEDKESVPTIVEEVAGFVVYRQGDEEEPYDFVDIVSREEYESENGEDQNFDGEDRDFDDEEARKIALETAQEMALEKGYEVPEYISVIKDLKKVIEDKTKGKVKGIPVDLFTANAIYQVMMKLSRENKVSMAKKPVSKMAEIAFKLAK